MARTRSADPQGIPAAVEQLQEMLVGARSELTAGRQKAAGTLAIAAAVRAVDLICDAALGRHSTAGSHQVALDLLATVPNSEEALELFSLCQTHKSDYNYHATLIDQGQVVAVIEAAEALGQEAGRRLNARGWA